jgi:adenylosuccinate lyase
VDSSTLTALSPLDGRYAEKAAPLREYLSEYALIRYRVLVEVRWLQHIADESAITDLKSFDSPVKDLLNAVVDRFSSMDARRVKELEADTNHDVKAIEYFLREKLTGIDGRSENIKSFIHFACTSEDINNLAYALMLRDARNRVIIPMLSQLVTALRNMAEQFADLAMLSRTHGQTASPTTLGKELANVTARLNRQTSQLASVEIFGKMNGAVGNFNAHAIAYPDCDWPASSHRFIRSLGLETAVYTTQIEPHDWIAEYCQTLGRCNTVLIDLSRDVWGYVSLGYFRSQLVANEVGSSTMPHKVNPIDFENAEGNLGVANALLEHFAAKLPISRWQRDLTDSTVLRNMASGLGYGLVAYQACAKGLQKLEADEARIAADLDSSWEVLAEAIQTVMRARGIPDAYEQLKALTRGQRITQSVLQAFIKEQPLDDADRARLLALTPRDYIGLAADLARQIDIRPSPAIT